MPSSTTGTMVVKVQSSNLSLMSPKLSVYTSALGLLGSASSTAFGDTVTVSVAGVKSGQTYLIRAGGNSAGIVDRGLRPRVELRIGVPAADLSSEHRGAPAARSRWRDRQPFRRHFSGRHHWHSDGNGHGVRVQPASGHWGRRSRDSSRLAATQPDGNLGALQVASTLDPSPGSPSGRKSGRRRDRSGLSGWSIPGSGHPRTRQSIRSSPPSRRKSSCLCSQKGTLRAVSCRYSPVEGFRMSSGHFAA